MELLFLLIFVLFIFLNIILGLIASRAKKRKQLTDIVSKSTLKTVKPVTEKPEAGRPHIKDDSFLEQQTADTVMKPLYRAEEVSAGIPEETAPIADETAPSPGGEDGVSKIEGREYAEIREAEKPAVTEEEPPTDEQRRVRREWRNEKRSMPAAEERIMSTAWKRIQKLPSLQRAVIFLEILGKPRGLRREDEGFPGG